MAKKKVAAGKKAATKRAAAPARKSGAAAGANRGAARGTGRAQTGRRGAARKAGTTGVAASAAPGNGAATVDRDFLENARLLVRDLEAGNLSDAEVHLNLLTRIHESQMFRELGKLTRELHNAIAGFRLDSRLSDIAEQEIPDARARLDYVIEATDRAAHKTLNAVEASLPVCEGIAAAARELDGKWRRFVARELTAEQFRTLVQDVGQFIDRAGGNSADIKERLNEVLIAQDFQDLTGQAIKRVIALVREVEESLVSFIRLSSGRAEVQTGAAPDAARPAKQGAIHSQDEVDDLLSSLGF